MEVVSTSNLVSSKNQKKQQLVIFKPWPYGHSFVMPHDLMRGQIGSYAYMQILISY